MARTDDIKETWFNPIRAAQAACKDNKGLAIVTLTILVKKNDPVRWREPDVKKIHPARLSSDNTNRDVLDALLNLVDNT